jgi:anthranilate phosphoribosyltransferase
MLISKKSQNPHYTMAFLPFLHRVAGREHLTRNDARAAMLLILDGAASTAQIAAFLVALKMKGETPDEVFGFAQAMRERSETVDAELNGEALIDTCGTGGGTLRTFNISTVAAFVVAGAGVRVAKHGNRSISSECGSADILEALGIDIHLSPLEIAGAIREVGIGFLFAPAHHPAMKHAQPARAELKMGTVFNLLGPLTNPARAHMQLIGASSPEGAELIAGALAVLGTDHAFVVHGLDGLDEVSTTGSTLAYEVTRSSLEKHLWTPADFGVPQAKVEDLSGGNRDHNCGIARRILDGESGPRRDIVVVNAAVALLAAGRAPDLRSGVTIACESINSGAAREKMHRLAAYSQTLREQRSP